MIIYHNPKCSKSRECLLQLEQLSAGFEVVKYLEKPLSVDELKDLIQKLNIKPIELVRQKEPIWIQNYKDKKMTPLAIIKALAKHPVLIERPIVVNGNKAVIARPWERVNEII
ncbi:arsenate reductase (glutaredoxin) [Flavobacterium sp. CYK-55]|uniref:arsenate reductase (glutaredoxin) n=1 Tax=Flavobacterium sp. CYK-55 TaxID=2835529 RepID=UPI001BCFA959|nr:arsenate reductase (glutaredoxin) [Flavobacterium sp. CYK-55]MBS7786761.1 arsenate reductase (glutaredoxin) [Flavobacterium sp. CYK-55]